MCEQLAHPQLLPESGTAEIRTRDFLRRTSKAVTITPSGHTYFSDPVKKAQTNDDAYTKTRHADMDIDVLFELKLT